MAYHFSANQYEDKYSPRKLGNWEYPKWYPDRPRQRFKSTKIIADDQGRLLAGIKRENAWGNYVGTWDLPKRITRDYVRKLVAPPERLVKLWQEDNNKSKPRASSKCELQKQAEKQQTETLTESLPALTYVSESGKSFEKRNRSSSALDLRPQVDKLEPLQNLQKTASPQTVKSTALNQKIKSILESVEAKAPKKDDLPKVYCKQVDAFPPHYKQKPHLIDSFRKDKYNDDDDGRRYIKSLDEHINKYDKTDDGVEQESEPKLSALENLKVEGPHPEALTQEDPLNNQLDLRSMQQSIAKRYHDENLRHKPLPDVIDDPVYRALLSGRNFHPDQLSNLEGMPSAIGWKNYSIPGPTECSKLKVYRPKTALEKVPLPREERPKTTGGNQKPKKKWLPIDLAICWDLMPEDPSEDPKTSPHIDGSNGSVAPAVFAIIHPRDVGEQPNSACPSASCQAVAERIPKTIAPDNLANLPSQTNGKTPTPMPCNVNKEAIMACLKSEPKPPKPPHSQSSTSTNSISTSAADFARKNPQTPWSNQDTTKALSTKLLHLQRDNLNGDAPNNRTNSLRSLTPKKHHQSTPNLPSASDDSHASPKLISPPLQTTHALKSRECSSAQPTYKHQNPKPQKPTPKGRNCSACEKPTPDEACEKQVFKAAFKAGVPKSESSNSGSTTAAKSYKVPKMRLPYTKKTYSIGTLVPPFSFWAESNGQEYPDHWRLASVYQHSYKPLNTRKRPMLASVYQ